MQFRSLAVIVIAALTSGVGIYVVSHSFAAGVPTMAEGNFTLSGGQIVDPSKKVFIPVGANANGPNAPWPGPTVI
jgi:hypothetical protein